MIDRIKDLIRTLRDIIWYITVPIGAVTGYIFYLRGKVSSTQDELAESKASRELAEVLTKKELAHEESEKTVKEFNDLVNDFNKHGDGK